MSYIPGAQGAPLGDAMLAGLGTGLIPDHKVIEDWLPEKIPMAPRPDMVEKYRKYYALYKRSLEATVPLFRDFS